MLVLSASMAAAGVARGSEPATSGTQQAGRELFLARCGGCHLDNGFGTRVLARRVPPGQALLERREPLDGELVKLVVRRGLGSMPQIRRTELSDEDLAWIARYLEGEQ
jgi:mono/diheme cytochrome c family protein